MPGITTVTPTGILAVDAVVSGTRWSTLSLTYSFPTSASFYTGFFGGAYGSGEPLTNFQAFTPVQQAAVTSALAMYSSVSNLTFTQITESSTQTATLRFAESDKPGTAWGYYPSSSPEGGDAWFNNSSHYYDNPAMGNYAWKAIIHEIGHTLGLKHPHDASGAFGAIPADQDSGEYSVMSYRSYVGATGGYTNETWGYPQTLMMYDIAAIQHMYGANFNYNGGNTVYKWDPNTGQEFVNGVGQATPGANRIFMTVWDGGGNDTYDFSNYTTNLSVNLQPGGWTTVSSAQLAYLGNGHYAIGNIANALLYQNNPASLIENAIGGSGNDTITGNTADNKITGGAGNDYLDGLGGTDTAVFSGVSTNYQITQNADGSWTVADLRSGSPDSTDTLFNIEWLQFNDGTVAVGTVQPPVIAAPTISSISPDTGTVGDEYTNATVLTITGTAASNSTVKVYDGSSLLGSVVANGSGAWSFGTSTLTEGGHGFTATATDSSGNTSTASAVMNVTVDTVAPVVPTIILQSVDSNIVGDRITNVNVITLGGTAESNSTVKIYDGSTLLGSAVANAQGVWTFEANVSADNVTDDQIPLPVSNATITETVWSTKGTPYVVGTADPGAKVSIYDAAGGQLLGSTVANADGKWLFISPVTTARNFTATTDFTNSPNDSGSGSTGAQAETWGLTTGALTDGVHNFTAVATDVAGNTSAASAALNVTIDTGAPVVPSIAAYSTDSGTAGDGITNDNTLTLTGSAEANATVKVYDGVTLLGSATANGAGAWSFTTAALANGAHSLTATATDVAGNTSAASAALNVTIDTGAPVVPSIASFSTDSGTAGDGITNDNTLTLTGSAEANATVKVYDGVTLLGSATANGAGTWSFTTAALANGAHSLTATATDVAGNTSAASAALNVTIDTGVPVVPSIASFSTDSGTAGDGITNDNTLTLTGSAEANATVKVYDGATLLGSATANGAGAWSFTTVALANGAHSLTATATDVAGNTSAASAALNVTIDTGAPVVPSIAAYSTDSGTAGDGITNDNTLTLTGSAEANATVKVYDGVTLLGSATANGAGAWSFTTAALANGAHSLTATATDVAGNTSAASAALNVTIDTGAPVVPSIASFSTDSGTAGDGITNDNTLTLTGSAEANATVKVYDGVTLLGSATANGAGTWSFTTAALANGAHSLTATATDVAGNTSAASAALNVTIDTGVPVVPSIASFSTDSGTAGDGITNDNTLTLTGSAEANATVKVYDGATLLGSATADGSGNWSYTTGVLANGAHSLSATATDVAGNASAASSALSVTIDTTAPLTPAIAAYSTDSNIVGDYITNDNTLTLAGTTEASSVVKVYDGATLLGSATADGSGNWSYTTGVLANGAHSLSATSTDVAGNTSGSSAALNVTIDTSAPVVPSIASYSTDSGTAGDGITNDNTLTLTGSAEANATVKVYDGATLLGSATADGSGNWSYTTGVLANGAHSLSATATDVAGNTSGSSAALNVTIDASAPVTPAIAAYSTDSGMAGDGITNDNTLTLTGSAEANATVKVYDGATLLGSATADGSGNWSYTTGVLANGAHSLSATATDVAGNTSAASSTLSVTIDTSAPVVPSITAYSTDSGTAGDGITNDNTLTLTGSAEANATVKVYDGATLLGSATANGAGAWSFTTAALANGAHSLSATATDVAGNTSAASAALNVIIDTAAPVVDQTTAEPSTGIEFPSDTVTVTLKLSEVVTVAGTPALALNSGGTATYFSGSGTDTLTFTYTVGPNDTTVPSLTITAVNLPAGATISDAAGNTADLSNALVTFPDLQIDPPSTPVITSFSTDSGTVGDHITNDNTLTLTGTATANSTVTVYDGGTSLGTTTSDASGGWSYTTAALTDGAHNFTATETVSGSMGGVSLALSVTIDTAAPVVPSIAAFSTDSGTAGDGITNDNTLTLTGSAEANATVKVYDGVTLLGSATANGAGAWSFTTATLTNGAHSLTATATDGAGNTSAASSALSVTIDTSAPVVPSITAYSTDSGTAGDGITNDNTLTLTGSAEANATVKVYDGVTLLGSATANGAGAWSFTTATLTNGAHSLTATATDVAGNTSAASSALSVTIDTSAPVVPSITAYSTDSGTAGDGITNDNTLTLTGSAEANATVKVYDGVTLLGSATANGAGAWSFTTATLTNGAHSLTATATDVAGNTSAASAALNVTIDTSAPLTPAIASFSTDSGTAGDGITNDNTLTLTGSAEASATVKVYDGATLLGSATANGSGNWSYTTAALTNGAHSLTATATDGAGNSSAASATLNVTIDTSAPVAPSIAAYSTDSGTVGDGVTNDNTLTLTGTAGPSATVKVYDGVTLLGSATVDGNGNWSYTTVALANGAHSLTATATDVAGNTSAASAALNVTIDTGAPVVPSIAAYSTDSGTAGDGITNDNTLTLTGSAEANATVKVYGGATLLGSATANGAGAWSLTTAALANGAHSLTATATDVAGNASAASGALSVTVDTTAPLTPAIASFSTDSNIVGDCITNDNTLTLTGSAEANATVKVYDGVTLLGSATANGAGAWSFTTATLTNGAHSLTATATDVAGNTSAASSALSVTIDTSAPVVPSITAYSTDSGAAGDGITNDNTLTLTGSAEANATVKVYDGATLLGSATANGAGAWSFTTAALTNGAHSLTATATDVAGNSSAASAALNVTIDTSAPAIPAITSYSTDSGTAGDSITNDNTLTLTGSAEANATVKIYDGVTLLGSATANGAGAWSFTTAALTNGAHSLTATATDVAGNTGAASATLNVTIDTSAPTTPAIAAFSIDSNIVGDRITNDNTLTLGGTTEAGSVVKVYDGATLLGSVTADGSGNWSYTTAALTNGTHSLTATATDVAGNTSAASGALSVTIDTTAPLTPAIASFSTDSNIVGDRITNDNTLTLTGSAEANATVKVYDGVTLLGSAAANGAGAWSFTTAALANGTHSLTATATDVAGNTSAASSVLSVTIDTAAPVVPTIASFSTDSNIVGDHITNDNTLALGGTTEAGSVVKVYDGATLLGSATADGSGNWSYTTAALANGAHSLTATATDVAGNTSAASTALGVTIDTVAPVVPTIVSFSPDTDIVGDHTTTEHTLTLTGTAEANSTVTVFDASTLLGAALVSNTGAWSFSTDELASGIHNFTANSIDMAGNMSVASSDFDVTVSNTIPSIAVSINNFLMSTKGVGLLMGTSEANSTVAVYDSATDKCLGQATANSSGGWSLVVGGLTANCVQSFAAIAHDQLGNIGGAACVYGTKGDDTLLSTLSDEIFTGKGGNDTYVFSGNFGNDTIKDFQASSNAVQLDHNVFGNFADVMSHASQVGSDVVISMDANNSLSLHNTLLSQLTANNFHLV